MSQTSNLYEPIESKNSVHDNDENKNDVPWAIEIGEPQTAIAVNILIDDRSGGTVSQASHISDSSDANERDYKTPYGTLLYLLLLVIFFLTGLFGSDDPSSQLKWGITFPPEQQRNLYMQPISLYSECADQRWQLWRLITSMLVHGGITHFLSNALALIIFGPLFEIKSGPAELWGVIIIGVIVGNFAAFYADPFVATVGCSGGMYAIMGGILARSVFQRALFTKAELDIFRSFLFIQTLFDVGIAMLFRNQLGWVCHLAGFLSGALLDMCYSDITNRINNENISATESILKFTIKTIFRFVVAFCFLLYFFWFLTVPVDELATHISRPELGVPCCYLRFQEKEGSAQCYM